MKTKKNVSDNAGNKYSNTIGLVEVKEDRHLYILRNNFLIVSIFPI